MPNKIKPREIPMLFSGPMVRAILNNEKDVTRRIVKPQPDGFPTMRHPYRPGDLIWVRETLERYYLPHLLTGEPTRAVAVRHAADKEPLLIDSFDIAAWFKTKKLPSIFMPKDVCRLWLRVTDVRAERLQDITQAEIRREGVPSGDIGGFKTLWDTINKKRAPWASNPWVWRIEFERIEHEKED